MMLESKAFVHIYIEIGGFVTVCVVCEFYGGVEVIEVL